MAIKYSGVPTPYNAPGGGIPGAQISLCKPSALTPRAAFVDIDWSKYTSGIVTIDLLTMQPGMTVDLIKSVFVDNIGLILPVTIFFPDTQFEVTCQPNATESQNVVTGNLQCQVILGQTSISLSSLKAATTRIWFLNVPADAFINQTVPQSIAAFESSNQPGTPQNFIPKPAGELRAAWTMDLNTGAIFDVIGGSTVTGNIFQNYGLTSNPNSYLIITDVRASVDFYIQPNSVAGTTGGEVQLDMHQASGKQWLRWNFMAMCNSDFYKYTLLQDSHGLFLQINPFNTTFNIGSLKPGGVTFTGTFYLEIQFTYVAQV